jgi:hypothetical protein
MNATKKKPMATCSFIAPGCNIEKHPKLLFGRSLKYSLVMPTGYLQVSKRATAWLPLSEVV